MAGETVLIVEDRRENIVHLANNILKPNGYRVITAMDGQRGLERILADKPDLVIMDLNLPRMDGLEVLAALRERRVDVPVILTTFYGSDQVAQQAMRLGAAEYVIKPFTVREMLGAIQSALAERPAPLPPVKPDEGPEESMPLTRQVERWMRDMNILTRVGKALVAHLDLACVCTRTVEAAIYLTRADHAFLFLVGEGGAADLRLRAVRGPRDRRARLLDQPVKSGLAVQVARSGRTALQTKTPGDAFLTDVAGRLLGPPIAAPLRSQRRTLGVLIAARNAGGPEFGEADVEWLNGLADYAAIAVRNAWTCQQRAQPPPAPCPDEEAIAAWRREVDQLARELGVATASVQRLAALLDQPKGI